MNKEDTLKRIDELWDKADTLAINLIEREARKILLLDPDLNEFIMAMGTCHFNFNDGSRYDYFSYTEEQLDEMDAENYEWYGALDGILHDRFQPEFMDMVDDLNEKFGVLGYPMRFTARGKVVRNW